MAWRVEVARQARKELSKLDPQTRDRILRFLNDRIAPLDNPRAIGDSLKGSRFGELWRYRVGDHRVIARIEDELVSILVVRVGHRREVYR